MNECNQEKERPRIATTKWLQESITYKFHFKKKKKI